MYDVRYWFDLGLIALMCIVVFDSLWGFVVAYGIDLMGFFLGAYCARVSRWGVLWVARETKKE